MSSSSFLLLRMLVVFLLFCLSKASGGTCLSYGHSCWGGHGKRSGTVHMSGPFHKHTSGWYVSKLLDFSSRDSKNIEEIFKNENPDPEEMSNNRRSEYQLYPESDTEKNFIRQIRRGKSENNFDQNTWKSESDETEEKIMVLTPEIQGVPLSKLRLLQIMSQDSSTPKREY